jgi:Zn-dependent M16 (insulinase) family peptidase
VQIRLMTALLVALLQIAHFGFAEDLTHLRQDQVIADFHVANLFIDANGNVVGAKFLHNGTGAPVFLLQIETVPQVFMWIDASPYSDQGLPHSLEHLLAGKGTKGRFVSLLRDMRLSQTDAATVQDFNFYSLASGTGLSGFFEQFHAWLDALYRPDFTDLEAEWEFYHFGVSSDPTTRKKTLIEEGSVYDEMQTGQGRYTYYFELNKRIFGDRNPFAFYSGGVPQEMRGVTPSDIRQFHHEHYRLGPTTGFIFAVDPKESVSGFLARISQNFREFSDSSAQPRPVNRGCEEPKYPMHPSTDLEPRVYPFPSSSETERGEVRFAWKAAKTDSQIELKLLALLARALGDGDKSLLYKSLVDSKTREFDSGATNIESGVDLEDSPCFPTMFIGLSGIPGNQISAGRVDQIRTQIIHKITEVSRYSDNSESLRAFNELITAYSDAWHRSEKVWIKNSPLFGLNEKTDWKEHLNYLEIDPSFVRSLSEEPVWQEVKRRLESGKNIWRDIIQEFHLLEVPFATASVPSPQLLEEQEKERQQRVAAKIKELITRYGVTDDQEALSRFEQEEFARTQEIERIAAKVPRPRFTEHPPLTADDSARYKQFRFEDVPVIATFFDRAPTIDIGLSFDLRKIPTRYYKYLPIFPRCLDSLGLKTENQTTSYPALLAEIQSQLYEFSIGYEKNPLSHRADLTIRASAATTNEFRTALTLIQEMIRFNDLSNVERLRDVTDKRLWQEEGYTTEESSWFMNPSYAFRYQDDPLYLALFSVFTRGHWDARLKWMLHDPVEPRDVDELGSFAEKVLSTLPHTSKKDLLQQLSKAGAKGLQGELLAYWERNIDVFPESALANGLRQLTKEVQEDLRAGPSKTITDLRELQRLIFDRRALRIDLTLDPTALNAVRSNLQDFVKSIPVGSAVQETTAQSLSPKFPLMARAERRYGLSGDDFPWYVAFEDPRSVTGSMVFFADFPGYEQLDRQSLLQVLASKLESGTGPHTSFAKSREDGLAYDSLITSDPSLKLLWYYGDRSSDIASLVDLVNSVSEKIPGLHDEFLIDYALQQTFSIPRSMSTFSERGKSLAQDIRDGNGPERVRRFSKAILKMRHDPNLLPELTSVGVDSISPLLIKPEFTPSQRKARSLFFFVGPDRILSDAEKRLRIPKLLRLYTSDFWVDSPGNSQH